jgi:hypothetical protein
MAASSSPYQVLAASASGALLLALLLLRALLRAMLALLLRTAACADAQYGPEL